MIACPFIAEGAVNDDEVGRRPSGQDLTGRGQAHQQAAATGEQLFRHKDRE